MLESLQIGLDSYDAPAIVDADEQRAAIIVEKSGNRFDHDLLKASICALLTRIPTQRRFEFQLCALASGDEQRQLFGQLMLQRADYLAISHEPQMIKTKRQADCAADHAAGIAYWQ